VVVDGEALLYPKHLWNGCSYIENYAIIKIINR